MTAIETKTAYQRSSSFFFMNFNVAERRTKLRQDTNGVMSVETNGEGWDLLLDVTDQGKSATYTNVHMEIRDGEQEYTAIEGRVRDAAGYCRRIGFELPSHGGECLIVGIVNDIQGRPVHTFEAKTRSGYWMINIETYKYFA